MPGKNAVRKKHTVRTKKRTPPRLTKTEESTQSPELPFPVVAIGASAGGLVAFTALLKTLPAKSGMAFVLIQQLEPKHESALTTLLARETPMPVIEVTDGLLVEPDHVYVIPPNKKMTIRKGALRLLPRPEASGLLRPIDDFSIALAEEQGSAAIGVILSGTGSDGTYGLKAIKAAGGMTFAQDPKTAQWPSMPLSAMTAGAVDFVMAPKQIAAELARIGRHPYLSEARELPDGSDLDKICLTLQSVVGIDFRLYKQPTVRRRIARRMALQKATSLAKYAQMVKQNPEEARALADDIFIHVTSFFRDPECFQALRKRVLAKLGPKKRSADDPIRIWVAGCATGEEVYSIAILLLEELGERADRLKIQLFGTDIQERAMEHALAGIYSATAVATVSRTRLKRFFVEVDQGYQVKKSVRELCVFARHDLAKDPPFSRLDLISCRNVLIYMGPQLQKRVLSMFQYALKPGGFLFLGNSESVSEESGAFTVEDQKHRIYLRKQTVPGFREYPAIVGPFQQTVPPRAAAPIAVDFRKEAEAVLLQDYSPPALIVDPELQIVHFQGDTSPFLAPPTGQPSLHLLKMLRPEFMVDVRTMIYKAKRERTVVHKDKVSFEYNGYPATVRLEVRPMQHANSKKQYFLLVFERVEPVSPEEQHRETRGKGTGKTGATDDVARLKQELSSTREHLSTLIAEQETAQEEMKAANEELVTLNDELTHRNDQLSVLSHDLNNLLVAVDIPVLVLDADRNVRRFTPVAGTLLNLIPGDVGRPFSDIASNLDVADWDALLSEVLEKGSVIEREVSDRSGHGYSLRARPYKTDDKIEGVLLVMLDTDAVFRARDEAQRTGDFARAIIETVHEALMVVDGELRVSSVNASFCKLFHVTRESVIGQPLFTLGGGEWNIPTLRTLLEEILPKQTEIENFELNHEFEGIGSRSLVLNARRIETSQTILIAIADVTARKKAEANIRAMLQSTTQSILALAPDGKIVQANGNIEKTFGYRAEELVGKPLDVLIPEGVNMQSDATDTELILEGRRKDGATFPAEISVGVMQTDAGKLGVAYVSDVTKRQQLQKAVERNAEKVRALASSLLTAQEEERRRVSRDLHDQICQDMAALAIDIGGLISNPPESEELRHQKMMDLQHRAVIASEEARHIAYELYPSMLEDLGLADSVRSLCQKFSNANPDIALQCRGNARKVVLSREISSGLYRIAQEALQNIAKHSGAKHASVILNLENGSVVLTIKDDGTGFDMNSVDGSGGLGWIGMRERIRLINGTLSIDSKPDQGTTLTARIPIPAKQI